MKQQYVGDISDYRKYALLRVLSRGGANTIGVCWMLTPDDGGKDGRKLGYLEQPNKYRHFDAELFDILRSAASEPDRRRLHTIEESAVLPGALYFNEILSDQLLGRIGYMKRCSVKFSVVDLVFFDPDNGLETSKLKGHKNSSKFLYLDEVAQFYEAGKSVLIYQHFPRVERKAFIAASIARLRDVAPDCKVWAFATSHVVFLLLVHPESPEQMAAAATKACEMLDPSFVHGEHVAN